MAFLLWSSVADLDIQQRTPSEKRRVSVCGLPLCGAAWQAARRLATAAVRCQRGIWPLDNRPQLAKLPHKSPRCLARSEEHTSELQSLRHLVCRLLLEKKKTPGRVAQHWRRTRPPGLHT